MIHEHVKTLKKELDEMMDHLHSSFDLDIIKKGFEALNKEMQTIQSQMSLLMPLYHREMLDKPYLKMIEPGGQLPLDLSLEEKKMLERRLKQQNVNDLVRRYKSPVRKS